MQKLIFTNLSNKKLIYNEIKKFIQLPNIKSLFVLAGDKCNFESTDIEELFPDDFPIFGGIFPQIIDGENIYTSGLIILGLSENPNIQITENISNPNLDLENHFNDDILDLEFKTFLVLVDGLSSCIGKYIESLFNVYGIELNFIGGGCGSIDLIQKPCIIFGNKLLADAALVVALKNRSGIGVRHGWETLAGPFKVNLSESNSILRLDNKCCWEMYKDIIERESGLTIDKENFYSIANGYPFGITTLGEEKIIRDPIRLNNDGSITCIGEFSQNSFVHIMKGTTSKLIEATGDAYLEARNSLDLESESETILFIDCISRALFLKDDFTKEIEKITQNKIPTIGALTLGEIANFGQDYLQFYNKTSVVGIIQNL